MSRDTICTIPWNHMAIMQNGEYGICCQCIYTAGGRMITGNTPENILQTDIDTVRNHPTIVDLRRSMLAGEKHDLCKLCWDEEALGLQSKRIGHQFFHVLLDQSNQTHIDHRHQRQAQNHWRPKMRGIGQDRQGKTNEAVCAQLQHDRRQHRRATRRRLHVRVRKPRVEWKHRHLHCEAQEERPEDPLLEAQRKVQLHQIRDLEGVEAAQRRQEHRIIFLSQCHIILCYHRLLLRCVRNIGNRLDVPMSAGLLGGSWGWCRRPSRSPGCRWLDRIAERTTCNRCCNQDSPDRSASIAQYCHRSQYNLWAIVLMNPIYCFFVYSSNFSEK